MICCKYSFRRRAGRKAGRTVFERPSAIFCFPLSFPEYEIPDIMTQPQAALFKPGQRAVFRSWCIARGRVDELRFAAQNIQYLFCITLPVGSDVNVTARLQVAAEQRNEFGLDQSAFVVALLGPRIGKKMCTPSRQSWGKVCCSTSTTSC